MEPPIDFRADEVRNDKVKVRRAIRPPDGVEERAAPDSRTETYAAVRLETDNAGTKAQAACAPTSSS